MPAPSPYRALQTTGLAGSHDLYIKKFNASVIKPKSKVYDRFSINALLKESLIDIDDLFY